MRRRSVWDVLQGMPAIKASQQIFNEMDEVCQRGVDADEMPNGVGLFGFDPSNPIPTRTIFGSTSYLMRLHGPSGYKVEYERVGSVSPDNIDYPVDAYLIKTSGEEFKLYFSPYQARNSAKAPKGLRLRETPPQRPPFKKKGKTNLYAGLSWVVACLTLLIVWWTLIFAYYWIVNPRAVRQYNFQDHLFKIAVGLPAMIAFLAIVIRVGAGAIKRIDNR